MNGNLWLRVYLEEPIIKVQKQYTKNKFEALKHYSESRPNVNWGFVRAVGNQLYTSNTEWDEDVTNRNIWKPIEEIIKN